ncbi:hypothetical protein NC651_010130 [Populus alba x Populus x berolinensis]|nr:hypothetical protein NC651_010130 [Populus alba x Populus x berolinensis]
MATEHSPVLSSLYPLHDLIMASTSSPKSDDFGTATCMEMLQLSFLLSKMILALFFQNRFSSKGTTTVSVTAPVSRLLSLTPTMHAVTKPRPHGILLPYKSQRKATNQRRAKKKGRKRQKDQGTEDDKKQRT